MMFLSANIFEALGLDWRSILIYLGNLIILVTVLVCFIYKPVKNILKKKREDLDSVYDENEKLKAETEKNKAEYDKLTDDLKHESAKISAEVAEQAKERADEIVEEARKQAKSIVDAAKQDAKTQKEQLKNEYRDSVNTLAVQIAQKILEREISEDDNSALIEQVLSDWEE